MCNKKLENSLAVKRPDLAKEWNYEKNGELQPTDVTYGSDKSVWWQCSKNPNHEWKAQVKNRNRGTNCNLCRIGERHHKNNEALKFKKIKQTSFPEQSVYFYIKKIFPKAINNFRFPNSKLELDIYIPELNIGIEYDGGYFHKDKKRDEEKSLFMKGKCAFIRIREQNAVKLDTDEPTFLVNRRKISSLENSIRELIFFVNKSFNTNLETDININRDRIEIYNQFNSRIKGNSLQDVFPDIAREWHPTKNGDLNPIDITPFSSKKVWWQCSFNSEHEWEAVVANRANGTSCRKCAQSKAKVRKVRKLSSNPNNSLAKKRPDIAKEWHPTKNGDLKPTDVTIYSHKEVWWQCSFNPEHEWSKKIIYKTKRKKGNGCPDCRKNKRKSK